MLKTAKTLAECTAQCRWIKRVGVGSLTDDILVQWNEDLEVFQVQEWSNALNAWNTMYETSRQKDMARFLRDWYRRNR